MKIKLFISGKERTLLSFNVSHYKNTTDGKASLKSWIPLLNQFLPEYTKIKISIKIENK